MKLLTCLFTLLIAWAPGEEVRELIILAGQSNAVGFDAKPSELPASPADQKALLWYRVGDPPPDTHDSRSQAWGPLAPQPLGQPAAKNPATRQYGNFAHSDGGFGPEIGFVRHLLKHDSTRKLAVLKVAFSGTSIPKDWDPQKKDQKNSCYAALFTELDRATKAAPAKGITLRPTAFLWVQGESDANATNAPRYTEDLGLLISAVRARLKSPKLPALVAVNTRFGMGKNKFMPAIVKAQQEAAKKDSFCLYVDTSKAPIANGAHYNTTGTLLVGELFSKSFLSLAP